MYLPNKFLLAASAFFFICITAAAASKRQGGNWIYYHFDGQGFVAGQAAAGSRFLAVRNGTRPVVVTGAAKIEPVALPDGKGALAGICYMRNSGGKLAPSPAYVPYPRMPVQISSGNNIVVMVETDEQGYFVIVLPPGGYSVSCGAATVEVTVESDNTALVPLRAGKRMVD